MRSIFAINGRRIGPGEPVYIVAEMSANHNGDFETALKILEAAKEAGADAVKAQTYTADTITIPCRSRYFKIRKGTAWKGRNLHDLYRDAYMPWTWQPKLKAAARDLGLEFFSTAFDSSSLEFLEEMNVPVHKIASFELVDIPLIEKMARTGKPVILSTGMASIGEIEEAVAAARSVGACQILLMKCTSGYPALPEEMNLRSIPNLSDTFGVPVGLSDHTIGTAVSVAAVSLGACLIEKHLTLSRHCKSADSAFSMEPHEFKSMTESIRVVEKALGDISYGVGKQEALNKVFRRSLFVVKDLKAGESFTEDNIKSIRPGAGLHPKFLKCVLGKKSKRNIRKGTPVNWEFIGGHDE